MSPLKGAATAGKRALGLGRSRATAPACSTCARVVSKWVLLRTSLPGRSMVAATMRSAARPWCTGKMCGIPVNRCATASKRWKLRLPA